MTDPHLRPMTIEDYEAVYSLWHATPGIGLNESDCRDAIAVFLARNPGLSAVAISDQARVVGTVLCGHDGRRGYLHHLAVRPEWRNQGIARRLIASALDKLRHNHIHKCNIFLFRSNGSGAEFWSHNGWVTREDLSVFQRVLSEAG